MVEGRQKRSRVDRPPAPHPAGGISVFRGEHRTRNGHLPWTPKVHKVHQGLGLKMVIVRPIVFQWL
jgi:hypothetical protein